MADFQEASRQSYFKLAQEREFYKYIPHDHSASYFVPLDDASQSNFVARPSRDTALTAFAQLGAMRLGAQRAMISLFDRTHQYILAEATRTLSLPGNSVQGDHDGLWLGCCVLPREKGICKHVAVLPLSEPSEDNAVVGDSALVVPDLTADDRLKSSSFVHGLSNARFYAGVPIISPRGITIGSFCILDCQPRISGLDEPSLQFMKDMAVTIMDHLDMVRSKYQNRQAERMIVGLGSFVEGKATFHHSWHESSEQDAATERSGETTEGQLNKQQQNRQEAQKISDHQNVAYNDSGKTQSKSNEEDLSRPSVKPLQSHASKIRTETPHPDVTVGGPSVSSSAAPSNSEGSASNRDQQLKGGMTPQRSSSPRSYISDDNLQDDILSSAVKQVFSRAANLIKESIGAEGVVFLDASNETFGSGVGDTSRKVGRFDAQDATSSSGDSTDSVSPPCSITPSADQEPKVDNTTMCRSLGFSTSRASSINNDSTGNPRFAVDESFFKALLNRYRHGKIFNYHANRSVSDDSGGGASQRVFDRDETKANLNPTGVERGEIRKRQKPVLRQDADRLIKAFPSARSIILLPMWDFRKATWFAGALVWVNNPKRVFTSESELSYISAFGNSIMAEINRLGVEMADKAKTNLISSISHELRSPLHGILGTADILGDTAMNAHQHGMVYTIESCGRTLLDTINNLLDFSYIRKLNPKKSMLKRNPKSGEMASCSHVQLDAVLEEVVESVFAGHSFYNHPHARPRALDNHTSGSSGALGSSEQLDPPSSPITVIFDIQWAAEWKFLTQSGAWRRILMNVFGNALKYTSSGFIYVGLKISPKPRSGTNESSDMKDSGDHAREFQVVLTVRDTGKGISMEYLRNGLFTPFTQENALAPGSGLGLSIVRQAVSSLGGSIEVSSAKDDGTELTIQTTLSDFPDPAISNNPSSDSAFNSLRNFAQGKSIGFLGFGSPLASEMDTTLYNSLQRLCKDWFNLTVNPVTPLQGEHIPCDFYLVVQTHLDNPDVQGRQLLNLDRHLVGKESCISSMIVICQSPEAAHSMFVAAKQRSKTSIFEFISQPCGPRKLAQALDLCIKRRQDQRSGDGSADEPTHWIELRESPHLPLDVGPRDPPKERMRINKRPTTETMRSLDNESRLHAHKNRSREASPLGAAEAPPSESIEAKESESTGPSVLLVEDNGLNLQLLVAYVKREGWHYMTAENGLEALETYKMYPGRFAAVLTDISMPVMDGLEAARQIRRFEREYWDKSNDSSKPSWHPTTIVALTGLDSAEVQQEAFTSGMDTFLVKPIKRYDVLQLLRNSIGG